MDTILQVTQLQRQHGEPAKHGSRLRKPQLAPESSAVALADVDQLQMQVEGVEDTIGMLRSVSDLAHVTVPYLICWQTGLLHCKFTLAP